MKLSIGACVVDAGYQGEVHVHLFNHSSNEVVIPAGEKIAQFVIVPVWHGTPRLVDKIVRETTRGAGGFGSSGLK
jgi:dUTP pyrophosphatase